ncbi:hypothetical protein K402DRAFT_423787 [Aulographum hederae CBS 113979]|uniref:SsDNA binding protein n=1 Tax=Aulographum hederae CBS 113979 TaxID=1176131 RepID=A0A6G1GRM5_9PEZI|nr:hypothetical protein K402DRAFT_423787 [Aulographum hederae CBS 113979]
MFRRASAMPSFAARSFSTTPRASFAKLCVIGRLAAEPELVATSTGQELVRYAVGVSTGTKSKEHTSWFRVASFDEGPRREYLMNLPKGTLLHLEANAAMNTFEDSEGKKQSRLQLTQRSIEVISRPRNMAEESAPEPLAAAAA